MYGWVTRDNCGAKCTDTQVPREFINIAASLKSPLPYQPWAAELVKKRRVEQGLDPNVHCMPRDALRIWTDDYYKRVFQVPGRVVILTNFGLDEYIFRALRAGASGFLLKDTEPAGLLQALRVVVRGDALLSPAVTSRLISEFVARPPDAAAAAGMETLTNREREVVALVAHGLSNDEIAEAMVLSPTTAKTHVSRAMIELGARDRAQLVVFAYQAGLVTPKRRENEA